MFNVHPLINVLMTKLLIYNPICKSLKPKKKVCSVFRVSLAKAIFCVCRGHNTVHLIHKFCNKFAVAQRKRFERGVTYLLFAAFFLLIQKCLLSDSLVQFGRRQRLDMENYLTCFHFICEYEYFQIFHFTNTQHPFGHVEELC